MGARCPGEWRRPATCLAEGQRFPQSLLRVLMQGITVRTMLRRLLRSPVTWVVVLVVAAGAAFGLYWFQPWKLITNKEVFEPVPSVAASATNGSPTPVNKLLASGNFVSHEHSTTGTVQLVQLADGRRQLVLLDLSTSDGPDLWVWLTDQKVVMDSSGWHVFDDGRYLQVGRLKGNRGNQVYDLPTTADLAGYRSVTIWCRRFTVSFGAAELTTTR
jgi:hypothetical protein